MFKMTTTLDGSKKTHFLHTIWHNRLTCGTQKRHFLGFKDIFISWHPSNIHQSSPTWSFNRLYIVQPSMHTSTNLWMNSWNVAITIWENTAGELFKPKGNMLYAKDPHSVMNLVFLLSSSAILTWWYPENLFVNE